MVIVAITVLSRGSLTISMAQRLRVLGEVVLVLDGEYRPLRLELEVKQVLRGDVDKLPLSGNWLEVELGEGEPAHWAHFEAVVDIKSLEGRPVEIRVVKIVDPQGSEAVLERFFSKAVMESVIGKKRW